MIHFLILTIYIIELSFHIKFEIYAFLLTPFKDCVRVSFPIQIKTYEKFLLKMWLSSNPSHISIKYVVYRKIASPIPF